VYMRYPIGSAQNITITGGVQTTISGYVLHSFIYTGTVTVSVASV
jgi:hypothetical protein